MTQKYYAHSLEGKPPSEWQPLEEHLEKVTKLAAEFADYFGGNPVKGDRQIMLDKPYCVKYTGK